MSIAGADAKGSLSVPHLQCCIFCKEAGHSTLACLFFACATLLGDDGWDPATGKKVSSTPGHLDARPAVPAVCTPCMEEKHHVTQVGTQGCHGSLVAWVCRPSAMPTSSPP